MTVKKHRVYGYKTPSNGFRFRYFPVYIMAYVLDAVGKKTWEKRRKTGIFQRENERKSYAKVRAYNLETGVPMPPTAPQGGVITGVKPYRIAARK
jgi:hypothetical protein